MLRKKNILGHKGSSSVAITGEWVKQSTQMVLLGQLVGHRTIPSRVAFVAFVKGGGGGVL